MKVIALQYIALRFGSTKSHLSVRVFSGLRRRMQYTVTSDLNSSFIQDQELGRLLW